MRKLLILFLLSANILLPRKPAALSAQSSAPTNKVPFTIEFSREGGFFDHAVLVELFSLPGAEIFYTLDGNEPKSAAALRYKKPIAVTQSSVLRVAAVRAGKWSKTFAQTYLINEPATTLPVVSVSVPPGILFDPVDGLFMKGPNVVDSLYKKPGANFWSRAEVAAHVQYFDRKGNSVFNSRTGFRIFGGLSRLMPQKSFAIVMRDRYGEKRMKYPVFGKAGPKKFKYLVFRNSGSDFGLSHFRDAFMTGLLDDWDIEKQAYQPCHIYLNGEYWGIYNIREKINRYFLETHEEVDRDSVEIIEHWRSLRQGSLRHYVAMLKYMIDNDLAETRHYNYVQSRMEVDNFMNYQIAQIYFDNQDAGGNIKFWRPKRPEGRWRWIIYDTDWGFGLQNKEAYKFNSLAFHTQADGPSWPNPPWSTFILRNLLKNKSFEKQFINRFCDHLNSTFEENRVVNKIDSFQRLLAPEMPRHVERWRLKKNKWADQVSLMRIFGQERPNYVRMHLMDNFDTGHQVNLNLEATGGGKIILNDHLAVADKNFSGIYFQKIPVALKAVPFFGYKFSHWEGIDMDAGVREFTLRFTKKDYRIRAVFKKYEHPLSGKVVINEISCNNRQSKDWIELYNLSDQPARLKNWILSDRKNEYRLPDLTIKAKDYVVICEDSSSFYNVFPKAYSVSSGLTFGLDKRLEVIGLYSGDGAFIDSLAYSVAPSDSVFTLSLLLPWLDNSNLDNWEIRKGTGTPNAANPYYVESRIQARQKAWMEIGSALAVLILALASLYLRHKGYF